MGRGLEALSEREKEMLRFLLGGHDAKSIARELGLSVHTVNERLRDARRKLEVSSSREAARLLAQAEQSGPNFLGHKELRVAADVGQAPGSNLPDQSKRRGHALAWVGGGMLIMSLIIAALLFSSAFHIGGATPTVVGIEPVAAAAATPKLDGAVDSARAWVGMLDHQRWGESWGAAGTLFKSKMSRELWTSTVQAVRDPLGRVSYRTLKSVVQTSPFANAPPGEYAVIQFQTSFARKGDAVETVALAHERTGWKVDGYFIR